MAIGSSGTAGDATDLLKKLRSFGGRKGEANTLLLVDLSGAGLAPDDDHLMREISEIHARIARVRGGEAYQLAPANWAVTAGLTEMNRMEVPQELKMALMKILQEEVPENLGAIDQSKLVRTIDLMTQMAGAVRFLEAFEDRAKEAGVATGGGTRPLAYNDIQAVRSFHAKVGDRDFAANYVQGQAITLITDGKPPMPIAREYYVRMDLLGQDALKDALIRETDLLFPPFAAALDSIVMGLYRQFNPGGGKCSLNLAIDSVGSNAFQKLLAANGPARLSNAIVEFKLSDALRDLRRFADAQATVRAMGGNTAIDIIDPSALEMLNLVGFKANLAKIVWRESGAEALARYRQVIRGAQEAGCIVVLCRVDSDLGLAVGREVGITAFQGFKIDEMLL